MCLKKIKLSEGVYYQNHVVIDNTTYVEDGKNVIRDYSEVELNIAKWYYKTFHEEVILLPRVDFPHGIKTPDYLINGEKWDLKEITGFSAKIFFTNIRNKKNQAQNFIFDVTKSRLIDYQIDRQISHLYNIKRVYWLNKVIIKRGNIVIKLYNRN